MPDPTLFHGIAVVVDDEINEPNTGIYAIKQQIEAENCFVLGFADIPDQAKIENVRTASFFIVDWNLVKLGNDSAVTAAVIPEALRRENAIRVVEFLKKLRQIRFAPIFIFTAGDADEIRRTLKRHPELWDETKPSQIFIRTKDEVRQHGIFNVLSESLKEAPSAYVLKVWEKRYESAKNQLFLDFYSNSVFWPQILWNTFEDDGVPPSLELGKLIGQNLLSRMAPFDFDLSAFGEEGLKALENDAENYRKTLVDVLEGEIFIPEKRLHPESIAPGDVFKESKDYYVNIRPECDCIARGGAKQDDVELYLLKGRKLSSGQIKFDDVYGLIRDTDVETVVFPLHNGATISFKFKELKIAPWGTLKAKRIGRLLPPVLTRLQQRFASYSQRPGLKRVPKAALGTIPANSVAGEVVHSNDQPDPQMREQKLLGIVLGIRAFISKIVKRSGSSKLTD